jgi:cytochrome P450
VALLTDLDVPQFDYLDPELRGPRFHERMRELHGESWLAQSPLGWFVLDRDAVEFFLKNRNVTFPGTLVAEMFGVTEGPLHEEIERNILNVDGEPHRRLRNLVNPALTARAIEKYRPAMRGFLEDLVGKFEQTGRCELVDDLCKPYPALTIATVMGAPLTDAQRLYDWSNWIQKQFAADLLEQRDQIEQAVLEFYDYAHALLEARRAEPGDDLISALNTARYEGDRLSDVELVNLVLNILVGGVDTTQSQLAHAVRLLAEHPDQWALLAEHPELAPRAVEETLRYEPIVPFTARITLEEIEYRNVTFPQGTIVMVSAWNANHEGVSGEFDITAERAAKPLTFGAGIHYCLGANVARAELQEALAYLPRRMPDVELDGEPEFGSVNGIYGLERLPLRFSPPPARAAGR